MIHCIWSVLLAGLYTAHTLILYFCSSNEKYKILYEETLDWGNYPEMSIIVCTVVGFIVMPICHLVQLTIVKLRDRYILQPKAYQNQENDI